jgi:hypothetical protein
MPWWSKVLQSLFLKTNLKSIQAVGHTEGGHQQNGLRAAESYLPARTA